MKQSLTVCCNYIIFKYICQIVLFETTEDIKLKEQLKISLICLDDFVPDKEVPKDFTENLIAWAIHQKKLKSK